MTLKIQVFPFLYVIANQPNSLVDTFNVTKPSNFCAIHIKTTIFQNKIDIIMYEATNLQVIVRREAVEVTVDGERSTDC